MKLSKLFSPVSFIVLVIAMFVVFGGGCLQVEDVARDNSPQESKTSGIPMLDITSPDLISTTTEDNLKITGTTDQPKVYVSDVPYDAPSGAFNAVVILKNGEQTIPVSVGNGLTTTTISLLITRE
ncbi:MAG: hypothetical protein P1P90_05250 [Patescibacteria group bacterium]|nr:hypothetical protein [Patescibacteria group bacterium]